MLSWLTRNAEDVRVAIDPDIGAVEPAGNLAITPLETTTYTLRLSAPGMEDVTRRVSVRVSRKQSQSCEKGAQGPASGVLRLASWQGLQPQGVARGRPDRESGGAKVDPHRQTQAERALGQHRNASEIARCLTCTTWARGRREFADATRAI